MAGLLAGLLPKTYQNRSNPVRPGVTDSPMASSSIRSHFASGLGLKIRVSAVRFCPWPLRSKSNARSEIGPATDTVPARVLFSAWRDFWRDSQQGGDEPGAVVEAPAAWSRHAAPLAEQIDAAVFVARVGLAYCAAMMLVFGAAVFVVLAGAR